MTFRDLPINREFVWQIPPTINGSTFDGIMVKTGERSFCRRGDDPAYAMEMRADEYHMRKKVLPMEVAC